MNKMNQYFDKIFVITVKDSQRSKRLNEKFTFNFETFYGVDGRFIDKRDSIWTHGQLGCTMSHINLYKHILDNQINKVLILEDDAIELSNTNLIEEYMRQLPMNWGMAYLFWSTHGISPNYSNNWFKLNNNDFRYVMGTAAIALQLDFVKEIYEFNKNYLYTADGAYSEIVKQRNKECYLLCPRMFDVDNSPPISVEVDKYIRGEKSEI